MTARTPPTQIPPTVVPKDAPKTASRVAPRIELEPGTAARLEAPDSALAPSVRVRVDRPGLSMPVLVLTGFVVLALGFALLQTGNFVAAEFARSRLLGWITLAVAVLGFGLILTGIGRELRGLLRLQQVDRLRRDLGFGDAQARARAARRWLDLVEGGTAMQEAVRAVNDPDAIVPMLRAGIENGLRNRADAMGRRAAMQVVAGMAAAPAPALVVLLISWRGLRLVRQVASLYGLRPGLFGTLSLLRRTAFAAASTAVTEVAVNSAAHAVLSTPLLTHLAGEMAGGAVAARRMVVLARATTVACTPLPPP